MEETTVQKYNVRICYEKTKTDYLRLKTEPNQTDVNKKASIRWQESAPPILGYCPTSEPNAG